MRADYNIGLHYKRRLFATQQLEQKGHSASSNQSSASDADCEPSERTVVWKT